MAELDVIGRVRAEIDRAKAEAKAQYDKTIVKLNTAHEAGLLDAAEAYRLELDRLDRLRDVAIATVFGGGEEALSAAPSAAIPSRPPTWKEAVLTALRRGPEDGIDVDEILSVVHALGVTAKSSSKDPALMVDATLYGLGDAVARVGRRRWALVNHPQRSSPENDVMSGKA